MISVFLLPGMIRSGVLFNSGQNSADLAQGSFIFEELLNFHRSHVLQIIQKLNSFKNNLLYDISYAQSIVKARDTL